MPYELPPLPYPNDALEPHIDAQTMEIHHDKHHQAYITNLNKALEGHDSLSSKPVEELIADLSAVPEARPHGGPQQRRRSCQPFVLLENPRSERRWRADRRTKVGRRRNVRRPGRVEGEGQRYRRFALWQWLVLADPQQGQEARSGFHAQSRQPYHGRQHADSRGGRVGALLLFEVPKQASRLPQSLVERSQLASGRRELHQSARLNPTFSPVFGKGRLLAPSFLLCRCLYLSAEYIRGLCCFVIRPGSPRTTDRWPSQSFSEQWSGRQKGAERLRRLGLPPRPEVTIHLQQKAAQRI